MANGMKVLLFIVSSALVCYAQRWWLGAQLGEGTGVAVKHSLKAQRTFIEAGYFWFHRFLKDQTTYGHIYQVAIPPKSNWWQSTQGLQVHWVREKERRWGIRWGVGLQFRFRPSVWYREVKTIEDFIVVNQSWSRGTHVVVGLSELLGVRFRWKPHVWFIGEVGLVEEVWSGFVGGGKVSDSSRRFWLFPQFRLGVWYGLKQRKE